ncbi:MAG: hypothetical protein ACRDT0_27040, partial [Pseudonocardiaceae bacterium]
PATRTTRTPALAAAARSPRHDHRNPLPDQRDTPNDDTAITSPPPGHGGPTPRATPAQPVPPPRT